ncbi:MAG: flavodoxin family protein [Thermoanaerobacteraceae bacterium]|uniref:flavodoxin family protein n=1 Tax=Thermanaeromonas sp. C210 TaxID=2731925 RepID=UPI00155C2277|nr:flavodoxin family protein [Thermanaeromonas sp. C210]MBE3580157.1 flavodoxin family protein [Thermoanaerobacteraceae bacterium]GFN22494.1 FMN reductase [Thermanaeromonas sp. C210]
MLIVGINGSPRKEGNTAYLLREGLAAAADAGAETVLIHAGEALADQKNFFCVQCSSPCQGLCSRDNRLGEAYDILRRSDGILLGSPVYFGSVSAQLKAFWDKSRVLRKEKALLNVVGAAVAVGGSRFGGQETTLKALFDMMLVQGMMIVGDGHGEYDCGHQGSCGQAPAAQDEFAVKRVRILGRRLAEVAAATDSLRRR